MVSKNELFSRALEVISDLLEGNNRFVNETCTANLTRSRRLELLKGQEPIATILTCSDSRVMPGYIFDQGLGNLFIIRTAGEALDDISLASLEYGVEHLKTPLLVVLGHTDCGAVKATVSNANVNGHLPLLIEKINPAVTCCKNIYRTSDGLFCNEVSKENVLEIAEILPSLSEPIQDAVNNKSTVIIPAMYDLESGKVEILFDVKSHLKNI